MKSMNLKENRYESYIVKNHKEYVSFIKLLTKNADSVCFTVKPSLDNLEEFNKSIWSYLSENIISVICDRSIANPSYNSHMIILKNNYVLYEFLLNKKNIFDFEQIDKKLGITLEDPVFIKDGEVICYTVTHEEVCCIDESLYLKLEK